MTDQDVIRVGSRKSALALIQTNYVISLLKKLYPDKTFEITTMSTLGDRILNISLPKIGEKSLFTKDLEEALTIGTVDMVVHSLKDLPTTLPDGMGIGAVLEREDPRDALVLREDFKGHTLSTLPPGSIIGTSSLRRTAQLSRNYPHLKVVDVRGNLNTRLRKLDSNCEKKSNGNDTHDMTIFDSCPNYVALILAQAGLVRMGWNDRISQVLPSEEVLYAVGQGALAIECKSDNISILKLLAPLNHPETYCRILAERSFLRTLGGGCSAPVAVSTVLQEINNQTLEDIKSLEVTGAVWSLDGKIHIQNSLNDKIAFPAYTSRIEIIDINSRKRKLDEIIHSEDKQTKICKSDQCKNKTDDSKEEKIKCCRANTTQETMKNMEIENLVTAHGKLLTACPYSSPKNGKCPLKFPIGQEFMGSCPFFDGSSENQLVKLHSKRSNYDIKKCPFMSNQVVVSDEGNSSNIDSQENICTASDSKAQNCTLSNKASLVGTKLYCGLTKHVQLPVEIIEKCENLGYDLAQSLIRNGALDVMHTAQEKIRGGFISN